MATTWDEQTATWDAMVARAQERQDALRREVRRVLAPVEATLAEQQRIIEDLRSEVQALRERLAWDERWVDCYEQRGSAARGEAR